MKDKTQILMSEYFEKFISESESKKRVQKNGKAISKSTIGNYKAFLSNLIKYEQIYNHKASINIKYKHSKRSFYSEKRNYQKFYKNFTDMLYKRNCTDNYVGFLFKTVKTFFIYLNQDKGFETGNFYKQFHVIKEEIPIIVLNQEQLRFLIFNSSFNNSLPQHLKIAKDIFVFGCTIGLRFSDLLSLKSKNWVMENGNQYITTISKKTGIETRIKLPEYAINILKHYKKKQANLLPYTTLMSFNKKLKLIGLLAGWDYEVGKVRSKRGIKKEMKIEGKPYRFCDLLSSHVMRRTSITSLLTLGMPEQIVRKISGHKSNSTEFYKYVKFSESFQDNETDKAFSKLLSL